MKNIVGYIRIILLLCTGTMLSCSDSILNEAPGSFLNPDVVLVNKAGFETSLTAIHARLRNAYFVDNDNTTKSFFIFHEGTDISMTKDARYNDYPQTVTPTMTQAEYVWNLSYATILPIANMIITYADKPTAEWNNEEEKNAIVAEARFFRAYAHNILANLFGGVPIADEFYSKPKLDYVRVSREDVYKFVADDLEFASNWLPKEASSPGRIVKAAADHLLSEVYISLGRYDDAVNSASTVIESGKYTLMTERFGSTIDEPGDVYSDLFKETNQNRPENTETIWAFQIEYNVPGGGRYRACRYWNCQYYNIKDPDGIAAMVLCDSLGRPNGWIRGTPHIYYGVWNDKNDIRCSEHNIRRVFYNNNPASKYFGQRIDPAAHHNIDTMRVYYPTIRKMEGIYHDGPSSPDIYVDQYAIRLAETYLLRAEAYLKKGDKQKAADDINVIRKRANAAQVNAADVDMNYILDERIRELLIEEPRLLTLIRTGTLVDRVRKYHTNGGGTTIKDHHQLWPIPQTAIDANLGAALKQNPGY